MLDANAFDYLLDNRIDPQGLRRHAALYITNVQHAELLAVPNRRRRHRLISLLSELDPTVRPAEAEVWPTRLAPPRSVEPVGDGPGTDPMAGRGGEPVAGSGKPGGASNVRDAKDRAIAAAARREGCVVVTDDASFRQALLADGVPALGCADAFAALPRRIVLFERQTGSSTAAKAGRRRRAR